jgi:hypothetical protein
MRSSRAAARTAVFFGVLAILAIPAAVVAAQFLNGIALLHALYVGVPAACALALVAVVCARRARFTAARSVRGGSVRAARLVAWAGLYAGITGALALAVYGALRWAQ